MEQEKRTAPMMQRLKGTVRFRASSMVSWAPEAKKKIISKLLFSLKNQIDIFFFQNIRSIYKNKSMKIKNTFI